MLTAVDLDAVLAAPSPLLLDLAYTLIIDDATGGFTPRAIAKESVDRYLAGLDADPEYDDGHGSPPPSPTRTVGDPTRRAEDVPGWGWDDIGSRRALAAMGGSPDLIPTLPALGAAPVEAGEPDA